MIEDNGGILGESSSKECNPSHFPPSRNPRARPWLIAWVKYSAWSQGGNPLSKVNQIKKIFSNIEIINWLELPQFDVIINATSLGLKREDNIDLDFSKIGKSKLFYDVIYNPRETNFLKIGKQLGNKSENGMFMFIYQSFLAFKIWHGIEPEINNEVIKLLEKWLELEF